MSVANLSDHDSSSNILVLHVQEHVSIDIRLTVDTCIWQPLWAVTVTIHRVQGLSLQLDRAVDERCIPAWLSISECKLSVL